MPQLRIRCVRHDRFQLNSRQLTVPVKNNFCALCVLSVILCVTNYRANNRKPDSLFPLDPSRLLIKPVRTVPAAAFAAVPAFEVVFFGKHDVAFRRTVKIVRFQGRAVAERCIAHGAKIQNVPRSARRLYVLVVCLLIESPYKC